MCDATERDVVCAYVKKRKMWWKEVVGRADVRVELQVEIRAPEVCRICDVPGSSTMMNHPVHVIEAEWTG